MRFRDSANRFNRQPFEDAYTPAGELLGQLLPFDDSKRDSINTTRRMLSFAPEVVVPTRRALRSHGRVYLIGNGHPDYFRGQPLRTHYVAQEAPLLVAIRTPGEVITSAAGTQAYGALSFVKHLAYEQQGSDLVPEYNAYVAPAEPGGQGSILTADGMHLVVRSISQGESGLKLLICEDLGPSALVTATVATGTYNRATETFTGGTVNTAVLLVRWQAFFHYAHPEAPKMGPGCRVMFSTASLALGAEVTIGTRRLKVRYATPAVGCTAYTVVEHGAA